MGIKNNIVSIWLGYFNSKEEFGEFTEVHYELLETCKDMSEINSSFDTVFNLEKYNREILEKDIQHSCKSYYELLKGASYLSEYAKGLSKSKSEYNCVILIYDYEYEGTQKEYCVGINKMFFFDKIEYVKDDDVSKWFKMVRGE